MATLPFAAGVSFGTGKPALPNVTMTLYGADGTTVVNGPVAAIAMGSGDYRAVVTAPDGFTYGWVKAAANDGSGQTITIPVNRVALGFQVSGAEHTLTFTVRDQAAAPISGAAVSIKSGATVIAWGVTNASGIIALAVPAGALTYTVTAGAGYTQITDAAITVTASAAVSATLTAQSPSPPSAGGLCTVRFYVSGPGRVALPGVVCRAVLVSANSAAPDELLANTINTDTTDVLGVAELILVRRALFTRGDGLYRITATAADGTVITSIIATIPDQSAVNVEDLIPV